MNNPKSKNHITLAGDIGGTNCRLTLCDHNEATPEVCQTAVFESRAYNGLEDILSEFLRMYPSRIDYACFGVPGPVVNEQVITTNLPWTLATQSLRDRLGTPHVLLVNDLTAITAGVTLLNEKQFKTIWKGSGIPTNNTVAVVAPGTGLGLCCMKSGIFLPSEGGHVEFAPRNDQQIRLLQFMWKALDGRRVSCERFLSGPGIHNIYRFFTEGEKYHVHPLTRDRMQEEDPAAVIGSHAADGIDPTCVATITLFTEILGSYVGNAILTYLSTSGIFIGGGIAPKLLPFLESETFSNALTDKGRLSPVVAATPVHVVTDTFVGLLGAIELARGQ